MTNIVKQIAEMCDGIKYGEGVPQEAKQLAHDNNCIIVLGDSDDVMLCYGADCALTENDGLTGRHHHCYDGSDFSDLNIDPARDDDYEENRLHKEIESIGLIAWWRGETYQGNKLHGYTEDMGEFTYTVNEDVESADFKVLEDGEVYCTGKVIQLK